VAAVSAREEEDSLLLNDEGDEADRVSREAQWRTLPALRINGYPGGEKYHGRRTLLRKNIDGGRKGVEKQCACVYAGKKPLRSQGEKKSPT